MSLNKDMHPRNPYKDKPPDFKTLAVEFPEFRKYCKLSNSGKVFVNFQEDAAVRCLSKTLLKKDFNLDVEMPIGSLVPRVPQRLNYCLVIDDLLKINRMEKEVIGIDIGTGASCIYALLGAKQFGWKFVATDGDEKSVEVAHRNVAKNGLGEQICVAHVDPTTKTVLMDVINQLEITRDFTFCMCNPPFFESSETDQKFCSEPSLGGQKYSNRVVLEERSAPHSATFASSSELQVDGGEVQFVNRIIDDSVILRNKIRIYTSMLGRKQSLKPLQRRLDRLGSDVKVMVSTLNQGKTQRWIIAWTFCSDILLTSMERPILLKFPAPALIRLEEQMKALDAKTRRETEFCSTFECQRITWTHQRARRRAEAKLVADGGAKRRRFDSNDVANQTSLGIGDGRDSLSDAGNFEICQIDGIVGICRNISIQAYFPCDFNQQGIRFRASVTNFDNSNDQEINFELLSGSKHHLHQLLQFLRNSIRR